ncbi:MAG TPA: serine hydrolase domain-containing protein [Jatrophihabitans sp.]|jgi:CubicO group peptidase (beta-lactamase class C family)|nr:serine hydrolase domain-containing protein [Jatrophihabitans sp.]
MRDIGGLLTGVVQEIDAPGAALAIAAEGEVREFAAGIANIDTGVEMTPDTLFPIASITKVFTATLVMQLVDEGRVDLDRPVRDYLPDFRVADEAATRTVTIRQLLTHTSGIDGDKEDAFGRGDDALARYVADCATLGQTHPPGATFSYCNSGFNILGHLVAVLRNQTWDDAIGERVFEPLGMQHSGTLPEHVIWRRLAAGHQRGDDGRPELLPVWEAERAHGPAGGVVSSARQLLDFAAAFMSSGNAGLLSAASMRAMTSPQVTLPNPHDDETHQGLGWALARYPGQPGPRSGRRSRSWWPVSRSTDSARRWPRRRASGFAASRHPACRRPVQPPTSSTTAPRTCCGCATCPSRSRPGPGPSHRSAK